LKVSASGFLKESGGPPWTYAPSKGEEKCAKAARRCIDAEGGTGDGTVWKGAHPRFRCQSTELPRLVVEGGSRLKRQRSARSGGDS
jgi:hypothetical protein